MRVIEQEVHNDLAVDLSLCCILEQDGEYITIDKQGAKQLIEVLKEFVDE